MGDRGWGIAGGGTAVPIPHHPSLIPVPLPPEPPQIGMTFRDPHYHLKLMKDKLISIIGWAGGALLATAVLCLGACESAFQKIDRRTNALLAETNTALGDDTQDPRLSWTPGQKPDKLRGEYLTEYNPPTVNPPARDLLFTPDGDAAYVNARLERYAEPPNEAIELDLMGALQYAVKNSREYRLAEEDYVLEALRLLSERHLWGPRVFNDTSVEFIDRGLDGFHNTSVRLVNDLRVTQRLPYGGEFTASLLAQVTQGLHERISTDRVDSLDVLFTLDIPLLRGAGMVAREDLIQAERNVVYAARTFERFRREFLVDITTDFLDLVIQQQAIYNAVENVEKLERFEAREVALTEAGRQPPFQAALSAQSTLFARDRLNNQRESYRLTLDRFKVRLGMPEEQAVTIVASSPGLPTPKVELAQAVRAAMTLRLDLQNRRDFIDDSRRDVNNARNNLLADLNLSASAVPTVLDAGTGPDFNFNDTTYTASIVLGLPIDRTIERLALRESQVGLEQAIRGYENFRDTVAVNVRAAVRNIDRALFSQRLQEENVRIAQLRLDSIDAAPDRASARDRSEAAQDLLAAQDDYLLARRDVQLAILNYLLASGQLRVDPDGSVRPLLGMELREDEPLDYGTLEAPPADAMPDLTDPSPERLLEDAGETDPNSTDVPPASGPDGQVGPPAPSAPNAPDAPESGPDQESPVDSPRPQPVPEPVHDVRK